MKATAEPDATTVRIAARLLWRRPFETVSLAIVADHAGTTADDMTRIGMSMHRIGSAILDHERTAMRQAQRTAMERAADPIRRLEEAFALVGVSLHQDEVVRAGVRIAFESRHCFPERRIDPFRTWQAFVTDALRQAWRDDLLEDDVDVDEAAWLLVAAGMGTKDLLFFSGEWMLAEERMRGTAASVLRTLRSDRHATGRPQ